MPADNILRYEDIVNSGGRALEVIVPSARELDEPLRSRNVNPLYDRDFMLRCGERLLESEGALLGLLLQRERGEDAGGPGLKVPRLVSGGLCVWAYRCLFF